MQVPITSVEQLVHGIGSAGTALTHALEHATALEPMTHLQLLGQVTHLAESARTLESAMPAGRWFQASTVDELWNAQRMVTESGLAHSTQYSFDLLRGARLALSRAATAAT